MKKSGLIALITDFGTKQHFGEQLALALAREFQSAGKT